MDPRIKPVYPMSPGSMKPYLQPVGGFTPFMDELNKLNEQWIKGPRAIAMSPRVSDEEWMHEYGKVQDEPIRKPRSKKPKKEEEEPPSKFYQQRRYEDSGKYPRPKMGGMTVY